MKIHFQIRISAFAVKIHGISVRRIIRIQAELCLEPVRHSVAVGIGNGSLFFIRGGIFRPAADFRRKVYYLSCPGPCIFRSTDIHCIPRKRNAAVITDCVKCIGSRMCACVDSLAGRALYSQRRRKNLGIVRCDIGSVIMPVQTEKVVFFILRIFHIDIA